MMKKVKLLKDKKIHKKDFKKNDILLVSQEVYQSLLEEKAVELPKKTQSKKSSGK